MVKTREGSGRRRVVPQFLAIDFFCGAGGTTRGLIDVAGGYVIAGIDKDVRCRDTFVKNNKNRSLWIDKETLCSCRVTFLETQSHASGWAAGRSARRTSKIDSRPSAEGSRHSSLCLQLALLANHSLLCRSRR